MPKPPSRPVAARRRQALSALWRASAAGALPALLGAAMRRAAAAQATAAQPGAATAREVAAGVWVLQGENAEPSTANGGRVGNLGFVVGRRSIALIDTGSSRARADELLAAVRRVSRLPVSVAVLTHPAQEFLFGASRLAELGIPVVAHPLAPRLIAQRCEHCLETLRHDLGDARMAGTRLAAPAALTLPPAPIDLGGRALQLQPMPAEVLPANLTVVDSASAVLFTGALLSVQRIPATQDSQPASWQAALAALDDARLPLAVPAWGPLASRRPVAGEVALDAARQALAGYLADLDAQARALYAQGVPLGALAAHCELPRYRAWNGYPATHVHNIFYRYLQLEAEDLESH